MRFTLLRRAALVAAAFGALALPAASFGIANIYHQDDLLPDYDARSGKLAPTRAQKAALKRLGAGATWNRFGTPASVSKRGKYLSKTIKGKTAVQASQRWLYRNRALFGLKGIDKLELVRDAKLPFSRGHAVIFRQVFDGLTAADGGEVTVGISGTARKGWRVSYVSSSLTRDSALSGTAKLSAAQAWVKSAVSSGESYSIANVRDSKTARGWKHLAVAGLGDLQRVKLVAFPTLRKGVVPAYESIVSTPRRRSGTASSSTRAPALSSAGRAWCTTSSRARAPRGPIWLRRARQVTTFPFSGSIATDGGCVTHGPFTVPAGDRALVGFVNADFALNDIILELFKGTTLLVHADVLYTPEQFRYAPAGGVPAGQRLHDPRLRLRRRRGVDRAADLQRHADPDDTAAPQPFWARWEVFPANPPLHVAAAGSVEPPGHRHP